MSTRDRWIDRHLRRLRFGQFLQRAAEWLGAFLFVFGTIILIVKLLFPGLWPHVLWLAAGAAPIAAVAWWLTRSERFTRGESVALLDRSLSAGGLLMTLSEAPHQEWDERLPQVERLWRQSLPRIRPRRFSTYVGLPLLFTFAVCCLPLRTGSARMVEPLTVGQQAAHELEEMLEQLELVEVLDEEEEAELRDEVAKLMEETKDSPLTHERWETVDALEQRMLLKLDEATALADKTAASASLLALASAGELGDVSADRLDQLEKDVLEALEKMSQTGQLGAAPQSLQDALQRLSKNSAGQYQELPADAGARQQLLDELQKFLDRELERIEAARQQCQGSNCSQCGGQCDANGQCSQCNGSGDQAGNAPGNASRSGNQPGRGGVTRGRGDAAMSWGDESDAQGAKFKESVLPPGFQEDPQEEIRGVSLAPPEVEPDAAAPRAGPRDGGPASGRETQQRRLRPRHRDVVQRYFDSER